MRGAADVDGVRVAADVDVDTVDKYATEAKSYDHDPTQEPR